MINGTRVYTRQADLEPYAEKGHEVAQLSPERLDGLTF